MPSLFSKLFRRKSTSGEEVTKESKRKKSKRQSKREKAKNHEAAQPNPAKPEVSVPQDDENGPLRRQNSYSATSASGRGSSPGRDHTSSHTRDSEPAIFEKDATQEPRAPKPGPRVLSPRNQVLSSIEKPSNALKIETWNGGPVDLDESDFDEGDHNENVDRNFKIPETSPRLSFKQLQEFEKQQEKHQEKELRTSQLQPEPLASPTQHVYHMSAGEPAKPQLGRLPTGQASAMDDMNRSDASSSSFNLSTDAEDTEYEALKRRGIIPAPLNSSALDTSTVSQVSSPTAYTTDEEHAIFPALQTDDEGTEKESQPGLLVPVTTPEDEPGRIQMFSMSNETEDDIRAWTVSPSTQASAKENSVQASNGSSPYSLSVGHSRFTAGSNEDKSACRTPTSAQSLPVPNTNNTGLTPRRNFTSPKASNSDGFAVDDNFANFADFSSFSNEIQPWEDVTPRASQALGPYVGGEVKAAGISDSRNNCVHASSAHESHQDSSLTELLAQAKGKRDSRRSHKLSSSSVNSAPVVSADYLRQHHNLRSYNGGSHRESRTSEKATSVSDIINSLQAANASRLKTSTRSSSQRNLREQSDALSNQSRDATSSVRSAKERLREKRRLEREREMGSSSRRHRSRSSEVDSSEGSDNEASESWLFDEVTGALGPRGIAADLESLSGRSSRSKSSAGNKSNRSYRSRRSSRRKHHKSSGESVDSRGSRTSRTSRNSRNSRGSRYSHRSARSTRSYLSQMSEQSRSVANDLLRLEMQLAMVGSQENRDDAHAARGSASIGTTSVGGTSRASRKSRTSSTRRTSGSIAKRSKLTVVAPPGKLGIILANKADSKGTVVSGVRTSSVLAEKISPGDRIVAIDGEDVSRMTVSEITTIMARKSDFERTLTVLSTSKHLALTSEATVHDSRSPTRATDYESYAYRH